MPDTLLCITHPQLATKVLCYTGGLHAVNIPGEREPLLIVKMPSQYLLTARMNKGFRIYIAPIEIDGISTVGLMSAFFEDDECPLILWTPLGDDLHSGTLLSSLLNEMITVRMFDEHDRELLGYRCAVDVPIMSRVRIEHTKLYPSEHEFTHVMHEQGALWFSIRNENDDKDAISIIFQEPLYPDDRVFRDERPELFQFHGAKSVHEVPLEKREPGKYQEIDIALLLQRVFRPEQIYHSPKRCDNNDEIADLLVITDSLCLIVQAKDSEHTERVLGNSLERKRSKSLKQLDSACTQALGSLNYLVRFQPLRMRIDGREDVIDIGGREVLFLMVVRELFLDMYEEYSERLFELFDDIDQPCIALDYSELIQYTTFCNSESRFLSAYFQVFDKARELGEFPRLRFGVRDLYNENGLLRFEL